MFLQQYISLFETIFFRIILPECSKLIMLYCSLAPEVIASLLIQMHALKLLNKRLIFPVQIELPPRAQGTYLSLQREVVAVLPTNRRDRLCVCIFFAFEGFVQHRTIAPLHNLLQITSSSQIIYIYMDGLPSPLTPGLYHLLPLQWSLYFETNTPLPHPLHIPHTDSFLFDFKQHIIEQLSEVCNGIIFKTVLFNPQISDMSMFRVVAQIPHAVHLPLIYLQTNDYPYRPQLVRIVLCSDRESDAFVGYLSQGTPLETIITHLTHTLHYTILPNTKFNLPEKNALFNHPWDTIKSYTISDNLTVMVFNLHKHTSVPPNAYDMDTQDIQDIEYILRSQPTQSKREEQNESLLSHVSRREEHTLSTVAQTIIDAQASSTEYACDRVKKLFKSRGPEEVDQLKIYSRKMIHNEEEIRVPSGGVEEMCHSLNKMAEWIITKMEKSAWMEKDKDNTDQE